MSTSDNAREREIDEVISKQAIHELAVRYMRGLDRWDRELLRSVFHEDATVDYGFFKGKAMDFADFAMNALSTHLANHHMIGQTLIEVDGDRGAGEVYFQAFHRLKDAVGNESDFVVVGRYVDRYERRNGVWKMSFRSEVNDWIRTDPAIDEWGTKMPSALRGGRRDDASYQVLPLRRG